jgi:hypothetical protein
LGLYGKLFGKMKEAKGDMFAEYLSPEVVYVITTNGYVKNNGEAVMGRGVAKVAAQLRKNTPSILGDLLLAHGNIPFVLPGNFVTLPVKHKWSEKADLELIEQSLIKFRNLYYTYGWRDRQIYVPRPGCGNGQLQWEEVRPLMERFTRDSDNVTVWSL